MLDFIKRYIPDTLLNIVRPIYHYCFAVIGVLVYRHPTRNIKVIGVTGTKGKTSTTEIINAIFEEAGYKTAVSNSVRFKIGDTVHRNTKKMTMPGRGFLQHFFREAVDAGCEYAIVELTSEGTIQYRHKFIQLNTFVFTNLSPEHIEAHGSYENYRAAKLTYARLIEKSPKPDRTIVANVDDEAGDMFLDFAVEETRPYSLAMLDSYAVDANGFTIQLEDTRIHSPLGGTFNIYNSLAAIEVARAEDIPLKTTKRALEAFGGIPGRLERIQPKDKTLRDAQDFTVVVDYAHTPDSLEKVYQVFEKRNKICVLGNTGGGRDTWKRPKMAKIAENYCEHIILTNEDPYDEDPQKIVDEMANALTIPKYNIIMDRREAIHHALSRAEEDDVVLITGKGTDPYIMGPNGSKTPWDDATITREELENILSDKTFENTKKEAGAS